MALVTVNHVVLASRERFFYRPTGVKEMHGGRKVVEADLSSLLDHVEDCAENPHLAILLNEDPIPKEFYEAHQRLKQEVKDDPGLAKDVSNYIPTPARLFLKSAKHALVLNTRRSLREAIELGLSARDLRRMKLIECNEKGEPLDDTGALIPPDHPARSERYIRQISEDEIYNGLAYAGMRSRQRRVVTLVEAIEGLKLFTYADISRHPHDKITFKRYTPERRGKIKGVTYKVEIPSRSPNQEGQPKNYQFWMHHVPLPDADSRYIVWTEEHAQGGQAENAEYHIDNEFVLDPFVWSAHAQAAHMAIAHSLAHPPKSQEPQFLDMPVPLITQFMVEKVYNILRTRVLLAVHDDETKRTRKQALNEAQLEIMLWKAVARYGYERTLDIDPKTQPAIQDYAWQLR